MSYSKEVERKLAKLEALEAGGVDNWEWYSESLSDWFKENKIDEAKALFIESLNDILAEAKVSEPAGHGCGYSIEYDEDVVESLLDDYVKQVQKD